MKDPTVWADSKCSQKPKEQPDEDWNVWEDFLEVVELEQGSKVPVESRRARRAKGRHTKYALGCWSIHSSYSLGRFLFCCKWIPLPWACSPPLPLPPKLFPVMVDFMCHFDWAMMPRCVFKHYFACFYEGVLGWDLQLNQWTLSKADCPP